MMLQTSLSNVKTSGTMFWNRTFSWFYFPFSPSFLSAASDHYLIGNNITVAVLGIVIPIGEWSCLSASPCLLLHSLLVAQVLHVVLKCLLPGCLHMYYLYPPDCLKVVYFRFNNNRFCLLKVKGSNLSLSSDA